MLGISFYKFNLMTHAYKDFGAGFDSHLHCSGTSLYQLHPSSNWDLCLRMMEWNSSRLQVRPPNTEFLIKSVVTGVEIVFGTLPHVQLYFLLIDVVLQKIQKMAIPWQWQFANCTANSGIAPKWKIDLIELSQSFPCLFHKQFMQ